MVDIFGKKRLLTIKGGGKKYTGYLLQGATKLALANAGYTEPIDDSLPMCFPSILGGYIYSSQAYRNISVFILNGKLLACGQKTSGSTWEVVVLDDTRQWTQVTDIRNSNPDSDAGIYGGIGIADGKLYYFYVYGFNTLALGNVRQCGSDINWTHLSGMNGGYSDLESINSGFPFSTIGIQAGKLYYIGAYYTPYQIDTKNDFVDICGIGQFRADSSYNDDIYSYAIDSSGYVYYILCQINSTNLDSSTYSIGRASNTPVSPTKFQGRGFYYNTSTKNNQYYPVVFSTNPIVSGDANSIGCLTADTMQDTLVYFNSSALTGECDYISSFIGYNHYTYALSKGQWYYITKASNTTQPTATLLNLSPSPVKIVGGRNRYLYPLNTFIGTVYAYAIYSSGTLGYFSTNTAISTISGISNCVDVIGQGSSDRYTALALCES